MNCLERQGGGAPPCVRHPGSLGTLIRNPPPRFVTVTLSVRMMPMNLFVEELFGF